SFYAFFQLLQGHDSTSRSLLLFSSEARELLQFLKSSLHQGVQHESVPPLRATEALPVPIKSPSVREYGPYNRNRSPGGTVSPVRWCRENSLALSVLAGER